LKSFKRVMYCSKEDWYNQSFGDFLLVEKVEQIEADDKAVDADDLLISTRTS